MATATYTSTLAGATSVPKGVHNGVNSVVVTRAGIATSATAGTTFRLAKIPDRATVLGGNLWVIPGAGALDLKLNLTRLDASGTAVTMTSLLASTTGSVTAMYDISGPAGIGYQVSLSDDAVNKYVFLDAVVFAVGTISLAPSVKVVLNYLGNDGA